MIWNTRKKRVVSILLSLVMIIGVMEMNCFPARAAESDELAIKGYCHIQNVGDSNGTYKTIDGHKTLVLGSRGKSQRLEAMSLTLENNTGIYGNIKYRVHIQNIGWTNWLQGGSFAGTRGKSYRLEGIQICLTGDLATAYDVRYRTHIQNIGDAQGWVYNGMMAGTEGRSFRLEELQIQFIKKTKSNAAVSVAYKTHVQNEGWENLWSHDGQVAGTMGRSLRLEGIYINLAQQPYTGAIAYRTHVQNIGWQDWKYNGAMSGTSGKSYRLEAIQIYLTGEMAEHYDIYYRVHAQNFGWLGWAANGNPAGTAGRSLRLEGIQIVIKEKGMESPGSVLGIKSAYEQPFSYTDIRQIPDNPAQYALPEKPSTGEEYSEWCRYPEFLNHDWVQTSATEVPATYETRTTKTGDAHTVGIYSQLIWGERGYHLGSYFSGAWKTSRLIELRHLAAFPATYRTANVVTGRAYTHKQFKCSRCGATKTSNIYHGDYMGAEKVLSEDYFYDRYETITTPVLQHDEFLECKHGDFMTDDNDEGRQYMLQHLEKCHQLSTLDGNAGASRWYTDVDRLATKYQFRYLDNEGHAVNENEYSFYEFDDSVIEGNYLPTHSSPVFVLYKDIIDTRMEYTGWDEERASLRSLYSNPNGSSSEPEHTHQWTLISAKRTPAKTEALSGQANGGYSITLYRCKFEDCGVTTNPVGEESRPNGKVYNDPYYLMASGRSWSLEAHEYLADGSDMRIPVYTRSFPGRYKITEPEYKTSTYRCSICGQEKSERVSLGSPAGTVKNVNEESRWKWSEYQIKEKTIMGQTISCSNSNCPGFITDNNEEGIEIMRSHFLKYHGSNISQNVRIYDVVSTPLAVDSYYYYTNNNGEILDETNYKYRTYTAQTMGKYYPTESSPIYADYPSIVNIRRSNANAYQENVELNRKRGYSNPDNIPVLKYGFDLTNAFQ